MRRGMISLSLILFWVHSTFVNGNSLDTAARGSLLEPVVRQPQLIAPADLFQRNLHCEAALTGNQQAQALFPQAEVSRQSVQRPGADITQVQAGQNWCSNVEISSR